MRFGHKEKMKDIPGKGSQTREGVKNNTIYIWDVFQEQRLKMSRKYIHLLNN